MKTDIEIQKNVIAQLNREPLLHATGIGISVKNGVVALSGVVNNCSEKVAAEHAVKKVAGVKALAENLQVGIMPDFSRSDTGIANAIVHALKWNMSVPEDKIMVKVENGVVSLEGEVECECERMAAKECVVHLAGVNAVHNYITVKPQVTPVNIKEDCICF